MILISAGLVLAAIVLLIAGFVLNLPHVIMWSIVTCVLSALFLVIGAFLRRHELFPSGRDAGEPAKEAVPPSAPAPVPPVRTQASPMGAPPVIAPRALQQTATVPAPAPPRRPPAGGIAPDAIVLVIPGRKRYHVAGCRQLIGRDHEELTYEEAREEGFTPCTACLPDAALGGRQLPPVADPEPAESSTPTRELRTPRPQASTPQETPQEEDRAVGWFAPAARKDPYAAERSTESAASPRGEERDEAETSGKPESAETSRAEAAEGGAKPVAQAPAESPTKSAAKSSEKSSEKSPEGPAEESAAATAVWPKVAVPASAEPGSAEPGSAQPPKDEASEEQARGEEDGEDAAQDASKASTSKAGTRAPESGATAPKDPEAGASRSVREEADAPAEAPEEASDEQDSGESRDTVKVIVGTRRYHTGSCPLVRGAGESGVETMTVDEAEAAGLTGCSVCRDADG
ncbi:hypothetical protein [Thermoactinospora rubra]|uniref:hypothetical protein n=1 Tax=Thermoactinospora rubra TaxID=1088767 RepID=UPI00117CD269|nr:hypothetical protein [Thermoactinospora rubra]